MELTLVLGVVAVIWAGLLAIGAPHSGAGHLRRIVRLAGGELSLADFEHPNSAALARAQRDEAARQLAAMGLRGALTAPATAPEPPAQTFESLTPDQAAQKNASIPFSTLPNPPAKPFRLPVGAMNDRARALTCLTMAVYYEAASESDEGQAAVAQVVLNRVRHPLFPKTVCGVVFQGSTLPTGCQFTFTCDGSLGRRPSQAGWSHAQKIAERALDGYVLKKVGEATHYHTQWVVPYWQPTLVKLTQIGAHLFYRWMGASGTPPAFAGQYAGFEPPPPLISGFDTGPTTVMAANSGKALAQAEVAQIDAPPPAAKAALVAAETTPLTIASVAAPSQGPAAAPVSSAPSYFGRPPQHGHRPSGGE